jgi:hypothetical protein
LKPDESNRYKIYSIKTPFHLSQGYTILVMAENYEFKLVEWSCNSINFQLAKLTSFSEVTEDEGDTSKDKADTSEDEADASEDEAADTSEDEEDEGDDSEGDYASESDASEDEADASEYEAGTSTVNLEILCLDFDEHYKSLKIDHSKEECSLDLIGYKYILTPETFNYDCEFDIKSFVDDDILNNLEGNF